MPPTHISEPALVRAKRAQRQVRASDEAIARLAYTQYGVVSRRQLLDLGFSRDAITRRPRLGAYTAYTQVSMR